MFFYMFFAGRFLKSLLSEAMGALMQLFTSGHRYVASIIDKKQGKKKGRKPLHTVEVAKGSGCFILAPVSCSAKHQTANIQGHIK